MEPLLQDIMADEPELAGVAHISGPPADFVVGRLIKDGRITRGYLGVGGQNIAIPRRVARHHQLPFDGGVLIISVEGGSPAERAGLLEGDVIVGFDRATVAAIDDLHRLLTESPIGRSVTLTVIRRAERLTLPIVPQGQPSQSG